MIPPTPRTDSSGSALAGRTRTVVLVVAALALLHLGREILVPIALAVLVSFALGRPVALLEKIGCGRTIAVGLVAGALVVFLGGTSWIAVSQMKGVLEELPKHRTSIQGKLDDLTNRFAAMEAVGKSLVPTDAAARAATTPEPAEVALEPGATPDRPIHTSAVDAGPTLMRQLPSALGSLLGPLGTVGMVVLFAGFMLIYREDLRNRCLRLISNGDLTGTTKALTEASSRIGRYLGVQGAINGTSGLVVALGLFLLGVPGWALWGLLYALLRMLPYIGPILGVTLPSAMALAVSPGWGLFLGTLAFLLAVEVLINLVFEPWLFGESTGISSFAVLVAAAVWTWLWGPIGLLLAMPLTVVVVVLGKNVPQLGFLHVLFGTEEALSEADRYFQRVVANDADEAIAILEKSAADRPPVRIYEDVLVPGLLATERDWAAGKLTGQEYAAACDILRESLEAVAMRPASTTAQVPPGQVPPGTDVSAAVEALPAAGADVLCIPAQTGATEVAATLVCHLLQQAGHRCRTLALDLAAPTWSEQAGKGEIVCIVSLPDPTLRRVRALCTRSRGSRDDVQIVVMAFGAAIDPSVWRYRSLADCVAAMATNAADLVSAVARIRAGMPAASGLPAASDKAVDAPGDVPVAT